MSDNKSKLIELWDSVASNYAQLGPNYWQKFGQRLIELSHIKKGAHILDLGTGRGATLFTASSIVGDEGRIIGTDIAENMVKMTNSEIQDKHIKNAMVIQCDMEQINFLDEFFHNVTAGFSIGYILNNSQSLQNIVRMLKKDGELSFSIWGTQCDQQWLTDIVDEYLNQHKKEETTSNHHIVNNIKVALKAVHLKEIEVYEEESEVIYLNEAQWWDEMWNNAVRGIFESIQNLGEEKFKEFQFKVNKKLQYYKNEKGICFNMNVIYFIVKK
ncbi:Ubiquinone/menaquinone biosynthesis C-methylase UbiE [Hathewaya proteolytica DSM 3090]|uniref:Ubiquinone/menaquinone biosynthesis C-methylase UbiE n=1 Tax=Hathewaya proteolytica DSM 3090 TaxID=1121331 RepID=A0A1M6JR58_9CLOT|nr:class I SAM-dependent methyltransferase [Hathewaya proteolytica]SHJ49179.1 Ubiquinone/menaquinone biosynthesis C-methylase UbiE [Hathewaya proteolytica DSM 3090]